MRKNIFLFFISVLSLYISCEIHANNFNYQLLVDSAYEKYKTNSEGKNADYIPALKEVPSDLFGIVLITTSGDIYSAGDADYIFSLQSLAKPFTTALLIQESNGINILKDKIGLEPTGLPFNSNLAVNILASRSGNPMVNAGAISTVSLISADNENMRWNKIHNNLNDFAGRQLSFLKRVYQSEYDASWSNRSIANTLYAYKRLYSDPEEALNVYTKQGAVGVNTKNLAMMGAVLANNGVHPVTKKILLDKKHIPAILSIMLTSGFYNESGAWSLSTGMPSKTGVGGGIISVAPGHFAVAAFSPRLNSSGNSIKAKSAIEYISEKTSATVFIKEH